MSWMQAQSKGKKRYKLINEEKYTGKYEPVIRSSWEEKFCRWLDTNENILKWESEPIAIKYYDPIKKKNRRYFPDFLAKMRDKSGKETIWLIEIKPKSQTLPPKKSPKKKDRTYYRELAVYKNNLAKWKAASTLCKNRGWNFSILTEEKLF